MTQTRAHRPPRGTSGPGPDDNGYRYLDSVLASYAAPGSEEPARARLREQLVTGFLPLARNIARRYQGRGEPLADLEQVSYVGLLNAINRYDPDLGHDFLSFAVPTITGEVRRHFRDKTWSMRVSRRLKDLHVAINAAVPELSAQLNRAPRPSEIAAHLDTPTADIVQALQAAHAYRPDSLDRPVHNDSDGADPADFYGRPDPGYELFTAAHSLAPYLAGLPQRERDIVIMRFYHDMTQTQIAKQIGVSQMQVSRLLATTLGKLRHAVDIDHDPTQPLPPLPRPREAHTTPPPPGSSPAQQALGPAGAMCFSCMRPRPFCACTNRP